MLTKNQILTDVRNLISNDDLSNAIKLLNKILKDDVRHDQLILLSAKKNRIKKEKNSGLISTENASVGRIQISNALLEICREIEESDLKEKKEINTRSQTDHAVDMSLDLYPRGPMVESHLIDEKIIESYAKLIRPKQALMYIDKANRMRKNADPNDESVTILEPFSLLSPTESKPIDFWFDAFHEARLHGPRMLAALLLVVSDDQFNQSTKLLRTQLLEQLINYK